MKKIILFVAFILLGNNAIAQGKSFLLVDFVKVDSAQESAYLESQKYFEKIQDQRIKSGEIIDWQLWRLELNEENPGYQYAIIQVFDDSAKMFQSGNENSFLTVAKKAFPSMSNAALLAKRKELLKARASAETFYLEQIDRTKGAFVMSLGALMRMNLMKVNPDNYAKYENAESKIFKKEWQNRVDEGKTGSWNLLKVITPEGNTAHNGISYISLDKFKGFNQVAESSNTYNTIQSDEDQKAWQDGLALRDINFYKAILIMKTGKMK